MATPADETETTSLARRAPTEFIPSRASHLYLRVLPFLAVLTYDTTLEQKNPCIRSQLGSSSLKLEWKVGIPYLKSLYSKTIIENETAISFPYPAAFRKLLKSQPRSLVENKRLQNGKVTYNNGDDKSSKLLSISLSILLFVRNFKLLSLTSPWEWYDIRTGPIPDEENREGPPAQAEHGHRGITIMQSGVRYPGLKITHTWAIEREILIQPTYVTLGIFSRGHHDPHERVVFVSDPFTLFNELRWGVFQLRGLNSALLSLRQVKSFGLHRCNHEEGTHERIHLDKNGAADLQVLLHMYKSWAVPGHISLAWANWIHQTLNNGSLDVVDGTFAIEVVLGWSATRISIAVLFPVLLSLAIGLWLNSAAWTDLATIQTAWGTASYVVTAGGLLVALLAIISSIANESSY